MGGLVAVLPTSKCSKPYYGYCGSVKRVARARGTPYPTTTTTTALCMPWAAQQWALHTFPPIPIHQLLAGRAERCAQQGSQPLPALRLSLEPVGWQRAGDSGVDELQSDQRGHARPLRRERRPAGRRRQQQQGRAGDCRAGKVRQMQSRAPPLRVKSRTPTPMQTTHP